MSAAGGALRGASHARGRAFIHERLQARRAEIEQALLDRVYGVEDPSGIADSEYLLGLRTAVSSALAYGLEAIERDDGRPPPVPPILLIQARTAARMGISLDTVLRRYFAGYALLGDYVLDEAEKGDALAGPALKDLLRTQAVLFDRLLALIGDEHSREVAATTPTAEKRHAERIERLLAGEPLDTTGIDYDFGGHHLGAIAVGKDAERAIRGLTVAFDRRLLLVKPDEDQVWAWFGGRRELAPADLQTGLAQVPLTGVSLALGEANEGITGWRLTHRQAKAALPIAIRSGKTVRYSEVALLAAVLRDDLLATSLREIYLKPIEQGRDGGEAARQTLLAYFAAERNVSSAAAGMGLSRRTVTNRLRAIERRLGQPLSAISAELEIALRLEGHQMRRAVHRRS